MVCLWNAFVRRLKNSLPSLRIILALLRASWNFYSDRSPCVRDHWTQQIRATQAAQIIYSNGLMYFTWNPSDLHTPLSDSFCRFIDARSPSWNRKTFANVSRLYAKITLRGAVDISSRKCQRWLYVEDWLEGASSNFTVIFQIQKNTRTLLKVGRHQRHAHCIKKLHILFLLKIFWFFPLDCEPNISTDKS